MRLVVDGDNFDREQGQTLMEILIASTLAAILIAGVAAAIIVALRSSQRARQRAFAQSLIQDMSAGVRSIGASDWHSLFSSSKGELYLNFDEGDDNRVFDPIKGNHGTINLGAGGNTSLATAWQTAAGACKAGYCLDFDGTDDYVKLDQQPTISSGFTVIAWVKPDNLSGTQTIFHNNQMQFQKTTAQLYQFSLRLSNDTLVSVNSLTPAATSSWALIAATWDGSTLRIYVDAGAAEATAVATSTSATASEARLGSESAGANYWNGIIDEFRMYNRALSQSEIEALYYNPGRYYPDNSSGVWQMKEGTSMVTGGNITYTKYLTYSNVRRDTFGNIVSYPSGTEDPATKKVTYVVTWPPGFEAKTEGYITQAANTGVFLQSDWSGGTATPTEIFFQNITQFETSTNIDTTSTPGSIKLKTQ